MRNTSGTRLVKGPICQSEGVIGSCNAGEDGECMCGDENHALYGPRPWLLS